MTMVGELTDLSNLMNIQMVVLSRIHYAMPTVIAGVIHNEILASTPRGSGCSNGALRRNCVLHLHLDATMRGFQSLLHGRLLELLGGLYSVSNLFYKIAMQYCYF
jgi:hypothetical protein